MSVPISGIVNTFNEEEHIAAALQSLTPWVDEAIVVDMKSTDRTAQIAASLGARVVSTDGPGVPYPAREFALTQASHEWVFFLDADEVVPYKLATELRRLADTNRWDAIYVPRCNYHFGAMLHYSHLDPETDRQLRLFKRSCVALSSIAHRDFSTMPHARLFRMPYEHGRALMHFNYVDAAQYVDKLNRYTTVEAIQARARGEHASVANLVYGPVREFVGRYIVRRGYRDGWRGLHVSLLMSAYRALTNLKIRELERIGDRSEVLSTYHRQAQQVIAEYREAGREARLSSDRQPMKA